MRNFILVKPDLHIVVTIAQHACDCVLNRVLRLSTYRLRIFNTAFIALIVKIRLRLDSEDFKLDYNIINVHFTSLSIKLLTHKLTASF